MSKPIIYYDNTARRAQEGDDGTKYATCTKAVEYPGSSIKLLGDLAAITDISIASLLGAQLIFDATTNRYNITALTAYPGANPKNFAINALATNGSRIVAVGGADGTDAYICTSDDGGQTWAEQANPKNFALYAICWDGSQFCAVGAADGTDAYIITSPNGLTWTEQANPKNFALYGVVWNGSKFCAVGAADGTNSYIVTSPTGVTWTEQSPTVAKNLALYGICYSGSLLVAVGEKIGVANPAYILTSTDGTTWTERTPADTVPEDLKSVCWSGSLFVAVGTADATDAYIVTSTDGTTWTHRAPTVAKTIDLYAVIHNGIDEFMAVGAADGSNAYMLTSPDGTTWTERDNPANFALNALLMVNDLYMAAGAADGTDAYLIVTPDGILYPDYSISVFERIQTVDIGDGFSIKAGLTCAQQDTSRIAAYAADNALSPVSKGLVNTGYYLRAHLPNFLTDGGFESGAFAPNWTAEATNPWVIESTTELEGQYSASWDLVASKYLRQSGKGKLKKGVTYRLIYKAKSVTANPTSGAITVNLFQTGSGTAVDADAAGTTPAITTSTTWFSQDFTPDFDTDDWYLNIAGDSTKANGATKITMDEFYQYEKLIVNSLIIGRHNLVGKTGLVVKSYKMSPLRSTVGADDYTEIKASFTVDTADTYAASLTASSDPVYELYIPATAGFTPQIGELYMGGSWSLSHYPRSPLDPWKENAEGLREIALQFDKLAPSLRRSTIKDFFARLRQGDSWWCKWDTDAPILLTTPRGELDAPFSPYTVSLTIRGTEVP